MITQQPSKPKLIAILCATNIFEWYEFTISGYLAFAIGYLFFPQSSVFINIIQGFATFALAYLARPIGALFWGYIADKYGSKLVLGITIVLMSVPTFIIGILPTYATIGIWATLSLVILRLIQGFAAGGEGPMCMTYIYDLTKNSPHKAFLCSLLSFSNILGILCSSFLVFMLYWLFKESEVLDWAWRIPFLLGLPLSIIIIYFRRKLLSYSLPQETETQTSMLSKTTPIFAIATATVLVGLNQTYFYLVVMWLPTYLEQYLNTQINNARLSNTLALIAFLIFILIISYASKFINYKKIFAVGAITLIISIYPLFNMLAGASFEKILAIQIFFTLISASFATNLTLLFGELFTGKSRLSLSGSFAVPTAIFGGCAPLICSYFIHKLNFMNFPAVYLMFWGIIALPFIFALIRADRQTT